MEAIAQTYEVITALYAAATYENLSIMFSSVLTAVKAWAVNWVGELTAGDPSAGYDVGVLAFEVIMGAFSGGASTAMKAAGKAGAKFLPRVLNFLDNMHTGGSGKIRQMLDDAFSAAGKRTATGFDLPRTYIKSMLCKIGIGGCFIAGTPVLLAGGLAPIDSIQLLDYAMAHQTINEASNPEAYDPYTSAQQRERDQYEVDSLNWYEVVFQPESSSSYCKLALHSDWMAKQGIDRVGQYHYLTLPEQGVSGLAKITSVRHILPLKEPEDDDLTDDYGFQPVTGIFVHQSNSVLTLFFQNGDSLGVTSNHLLWSITESKWVSSNETNIGDEIFSKGNTIVIASKVHTNNLNEVFNLEIRQLHNYLVNGSIVVHNSCLKSDFSPAKRGSRYLKDGTEICPKDWGNGDVQDWFWGWVNAPTNLSVNERFLKAQRATDKFNGKITSADVNLMEGFGFNKAHLLGWRKLYEGRIAKLTARGTLAPLPVPESRLRTINKLLDLWPLEE